jgi:hypothetical protein
MSDQTRLAGIREVIRAANGDWHEATALWSVGADLDWLLSRVDPEPLLARIRQRQSLFRLAFDDRKVTRAMLRQQAEQFEQWLAAL